MSQKNLVQSSKADSLKIEVYGSTASLGEAAANFVAHNLRKALNEKGSANLIFATGASQFSFLSALKDIQSLDWSKITTFHLDEYVGLSLDHPASFRKYLHERIIDYIQPGNAYFLQGDADNLETEIKRYQQLLETHPVDIACIGIGENGHIAFNDPPIADFDDPKLVKIVELDEKSRRQQVGEGWFESLEDVPKHALTLTIPAIMKSKAISCVVPESRKAKAVYKTLNNPVSTDIPASILRTHPNATLFLDTDSASLLE